MTQEQIRIIIAEACGWKHEFNGDHENPEWYWIPPDDPDGNGEAPDYPNDLNAMHEAEKSKVTVPSFWQPYQQNLEHVIRRSRGQNSIIAKIDIAFATAEQRAEAFVRTIGKWKE